MPSNCLILCCPLLFLSSVFPRSGSFPISQLFASGGQSIEASTSASVLPKNIQGWFPFGLTGLISLQSKGLSRVFSNATVLKHQFFSAQLSFFFIFFKLYIIVLVLPNIKMNPPQVYFIVQLSHPYMTTGKTIALTRCTFVSKVMSLLFNMLSRLVIAFLPRSNDF